MIVADIVILIGLLLFVVWGIFVGFGKGLETISRGIVGFFISLVVTYFLFGIVLQIPIIGEWLGQLRDVIAAGEGWWSTLLLTIRIDIIVYAVALFIIVTLLRIAVVQLIRVTVETQSKVAMVFNRIGGAILFAVYYCALGLIVFQILVWVGGDTALTVANGLEGSVFKLDYVFLNNPLIAFVELVQAL